LNESEFSSIESDRVELIKLITSIFNSSKQNV
jgi:hypothetical protein